MALRPPVWAYGDMVMSVSEDRSYVEENTRERERLRALVERLDEGQLIRPVNEHWTVAAVFGHIAFCDARVLSLADKLERGEPFSPFDASVSVPAPANASTRPYELRSRFRQSA